MSARTARTAIATAAILLASGSCASADAPAQAPRTTAPPPVVVAPTPAPSPTPTIPARAEISLTGELEQGGWIRGTLPIDTRSARLGDRPIALAQDGAFFAGLDRDQGPRVELVAMLEDGRSVSRTLTIAPREWELEHVDVPYRAGRSSAEFRRLREGELARIAAARATRTDSEGWRQDFVWPVTGRISGRFGAQRVYQGKPGPYHSGLDIARPTGTPYRAPADGVVTLVARDPFTLEGKLLMIDHGMGLNSAFLHSSTIAVREGERVRQGQYLGTIGATGRATGPHLHWSLKWRDTRLDPLLFLGEME